LKIALLQLNPTVGDLDGNAQRIADGVRQAQRLGADLAITSELALLGYPPRDLLLDPSFIGRSRRVLDRLADDLKSSPPVLVGVVEPNRQNAGRPLFNGAALVREGRVERCFRKSLLPTYDVFDEDRYFESSLAPNLLEVGRYRIGVSVCEDVWNDRDFWQRQRYRVDPIAVMAQSGIQWLINLSASPFTQGKQQLREAMLGCMARKYHMGIIYVNQVGGNDELVFDGRSCVFDALGQLIARGRGFAEDVILVGLEPLSGSVAKDDFAPELEIWNALVLGTREYVRKCGFSRVLLGLSGGIDSSVTAAIAAEAVEPGNVLGILMPSPYSSQGSVDDAARLARNLGIRTLTLPIADVMRAYEHTLKPAFAGYDHDVTEENIQARIRGNLLMALSNKYRALLLTTGNKSELAVGYCTLYGDMCGGLAVISDVPKTMIYRLAYWLNRDRIVIPEAVLTKAPSAELRPNQKDQDSLPPYEILDAILDLHVERHRTVEEIVNQGFDEAIVLRVLQLLNSAEFKRKQAAPGIKVTDRAFGMGWRMPVARRFSNHMIDRNGRD
jgi:NAD+ synthase (glutamine-hydrolysing)